MSGAIATGVFAAHTRIIRAARLNMERKLVAILAADVSRYRRSPRRQNCISMRLPTHGNLLAWAFEKDGQEVAVRVNGQLTFNGHSLGLRAALDGLGLGYCPEDLVAEDVADGRLVRVLEEWCPPFPGYHLYYPSRRQHSPAFAILVEALRYRAADRA